MGLEYLKRKEKEPVVATEAATEAPIPPVETEQSPEVNFDLNRTFTPEQPQSEPISTIINEFVKRACICILTSTSLHPC